MAANEERVTTGSVMSNSYHLSGYSYKNMVPSLNKSDIITLEQYKHSELHGYFEIDRANLYKNGKCNPNHVYELFGNFSGHTSAPQVRVMTLQAIAANVQFYKERSSVCLGMRGSYYEKWLSDIADTNCPCDELGLLTLSYLYKRHCLVYTASKLWSTIESTGPMSLIDLLNECTVRLVYLGDLQFGVLRPIQTRIPTTPNTQPASSHTTGSSTLPVESYCAELDVETNDTVPDVPLLSVSGHVETKPEPADLQEEQGDASSTSPAEESDHSEGLVYSVLEPSSYVFERNLRIKLHRLSEEELSLWIKSPSEPVESEPIVTKDATPSVTTNGYRLRERQSRASKTGISLRNSKVVNYRPMLKVSKKDAEPEKFRNKQRSNRPRSSGPSSTRLLANQLLIKAKTIHHQTCSKEISRTH